MKNLKIKFGNLLFNTLIALLVAFLCNLPVVPVLAASLAIGVVLGFLKTKDISLWMAVQVEIWERDIVESLFADNAFLNFATNADQYVLDGKVVHIPQAGAKPSIVKNRDEFPATASQRSDSDVTYQLDSYTSDPVHITNAEDIEDSYDKRKSVLSEMQGALNAEVAANMLNNWGVTKAANIIRTTGDAVAAHTDAATGNRKAFLPAQIKTAMTLFNRQNVQLDNRYMAIDAVMYDQLLEALSDSQYRDFSRVMDPATGVVGKLYTFNIIVRDKILRYSNAATPVKIAPATAGAAADNAAAIAWQKNSVERALGQVKFYENLQDALYYGDVYSAELRMGGRIRRSDEAGVAAIVQAASA